MDSLQYSKETARCNVSICHFNGQELERVNQYKYLGVFLDTCLDWNHHIGMTAAKISQQLGVLRRVRRHLTLDTVKKLYNSLVMLPRFDDCDVVKVIVLPLFDYCDVVTVI